MGIYEYKDYKKYLNDWINSRPNKGRGELSKLARKLNVHTTLISHTIRGDKHLNLEQGLSICEYMGLSEYETDYFLCLIQIERAGSISLKKRFKSKLMKMKSESQVLMNRVSPNTTMSEATKARFYSSWLYSAVRQISSIEGFQSRKTISDYFNIELNEINRIIDFLLESNLCVQNGSKIEIGPAQTHLEALSPYIYNHHKNWRIKGFEKHNRLTEQELMYSAPFTISKSDFVVLKEKIIQLIEFFLKTADKTKEEKLACFNIDLFWVE